VSVLSVVYIVEHKVWPLKSGTLCGFRKLVQTSARPQNDTNLQHTPLSTQSATHRLRFGLLR